MEQKKKNHYLETKVDALQTRLKESTAQLVSMGNSVSEFKAASRKEKDSLQGKLESKEEEMAVLQKVSFLSFFFLFFFPHFSHVAVDNTRANYVEISE